MVRISSRAMWLLHALTSVEGARMKHLHGYAPGLQELNEDVAVLLACKFITNAYFCEGDRLRANLTGKGISHHALWRLKVARALSTMEVI